MSDTEQLSVSGQQSTVNSQEQGTEVPPIASAAPEAMPPKSNAQPKTQGVRAQRTDAGRRVLERAAKAAAKSGRRGDVHEYMRLRRGYV